MIRLPIEAWGKRLAQTNSSLASFFVRQLQSIALRMSSREKTFRQASRAWMAIYQRLVGEIDIDRNVCGAVGCISLETPGMQCGRCNKISYCDKTCQRR